MAQVNVEINGKTFKMACNDGEEDRVAGLAERVDRVIHQLRNDFGEIGDQRLTVMASIMMADELTELERQYAHIQAELRAAQQKSKEAATQSEIERERRQADLAETSLAHQNQLSEARRAHAEEIQQISQDIEDFSDKIEGLARGLTQDGTA